MRILSLFLPFFFLSVTTWSQLSINIVVQPPFSPYFEDYLQFDNKVVIIINNTTDKNIEFYMHGALTSDNGLEAITKSDYKPATPFTIQSHGVLQLFGGDLQGILDFEDVNLTGITRQELIQASGLPEGNYKICLQAFDWNSDLPLSQEAPLGCSPDLRIEHIHPAEIITPLCGTQIEVSDPQNILFSWSISAGALPGTQYLLQLTEVLKGQSPEEAMEALVEPPLFEKVIQGNAYVYSFSDAPLEKGKEYAFRVQSIDPMGKKLYRNNGFSEVCSFVVKEKTNFQGSVIMPQALPPFKHCSCNTEVSGEIKKNYQISKGSSYTVNGFTLKVDEIVVQPSAPNWKFSGSGSVNLPWLGSHIRVNVSFTQIQLNIQDQIINGSLRGVLADNASFLPVFEVPEVKTAPLNKDKAQQLDNYFIQNKNKLLSRINQSSLNYDLPIGMDQGAGEHIVAITGLYITPKNAAIDAAVSFDLPGEHPDIIALSGSGICISKDGLCGEGKLFLSEDVDLLSSGLKLLKYNNGSGTFISIDKNGFQEMHLDAVYTLPQSLVHNAATPSKPATATLRTTLIDWSEWMADVQLTPFSIKGIQDFSFFPSKAIYDHSDLENPKGLPKNYTDASSNLYWRGVFIPELSVELPEFMGISKVKSKDVILDSKGVTANIMVDNVLSINNGNLGGWAYSIKQLFATFKYNSLTKSGFGGDIKLPVSETPLQYTAFLDVNSGNYTFQVTQIDNLEVPMWLAKFNLDNTSSISVKYSKTNNIKADAHLYGHLDISSPKVQNLSLNFQAMSFEDLHLSNQQPYLQVKAFTAGLNSPPKFVSGLPVSIKDPKLVSDNGKIGLQIDLAIGLLGDISEDNGLKASSTLTILSKINTTHIQKWTFDKVKVKKVSVAGSVGPLDLNGNIEFYESKKLGKGISGELEAKIADLITINALALFGSNNNTSYWMVDGLLGLPGPGIQLGTTPFYIKGFGGGAYYNLSRKPIPNANELSNYKNKNASTIDLFDFRKGSIGFSASTIIGLADGYSLNLMGKLGMEFGSGYTVRKISMDAELGIITKHNSTKDALITAMSNTELDFGRKIFHSANSVNIDYKPVLDGHVSFDMLFSYGNSTNWHFAIGDPMNKKPNISILPDILTAKGKMYFVMGTDISTSLPSIAVPGYPTSSPTNLEAMKKGSGIAFGASLNMNFDKTFAIFYLKTYAGIGFDINLTHQDIRCSNHGNSPIGVNGWYAQGQAYLYGGIDFGLEVDVWFYEGRVSAGKADIAAILEAKLPHPNWFKGTLQAHYSVLGGLISGRMNFSFELGEKCIPIKEEFNPFAALPIIDDSNPRKNMTNKVDIMIMPQVTFNYPVDRKISIQDEEGKYHSFYIQLDEFKLLKGANTQATRTDAKWGSDNRAARLDYDFALRPNSKYKMIIKVSAWKIINGRKVKLVYKRKAVKEKLVITFTTGDCVADIAKHILYTYPISKQRYFLKGESNDGFVLLTKSIGCITSDKHYNYYGIYINMSNVREQHLVYLSMKNNKLVYDIPQDLQNNTLYWLKMIKRRKQTKKKGSGLISKKKEVSNLEKYKSNRFITSDNRVEYSRLKINYGYIRNGDVPLFDMVFKTSEYNTFRQKISGSPRDPSSSASFGIVVNHYPINEGFDVLEGKGHILYKHRNAQFPDPDYYVFPLVRTWLKTDRNAYFSYLTKVYNRAHHVYGDARPIRTETDGKRIGYYPPTRPNFLDGFDPPLNLADLLKAISTPSNTKNGDTRFAGFDYGSFQRGYATSFQIVYGVPFEVLNDWYSIESNAQSNYILHFIFPYYSSHKDDFKNYLFFSNRYKYLWWPHQFARKGNWKMNMEYRRPDLWQYNGGGRLTKLLDVSTPKGTYYKVFSPK